MRPIRCAIYTRKSSEEGLDAAFNSLDAQREAAVDYIKSQRHEGWRAVATRYDDGGYSGGSMKRPALQQLMADIERSGIIDAVVVYKVDRLSRSLGDFARMMQVFDERGVSFVSVTQQFNTTTSMGRLTLNMLLSFAQFEREIAGERIRDKIAATKKKGYWVCGQPPLGYRLQREDEPRGLYVVDEEADLVRTIFAEFLRSGSPVRVAETLNGEGKTTKRWFSSTGRWHGGKPLTPKYIHGLLTNPVLAGRITHTRGGVTEVHDGLHDAIVDEATWNAVQESIRVSARQSEHRWSKPHLLKGKLRTHEDFAMSPTTVQRPGSKRGNGAGKRFVRYYVSQKAMRRGFKSCPIKTINAEHLDGVVRALVLEHVGVPALTGQPGEVRDHWVRTLLEGVSLSPETLDVRIGRDQIAALGQHDFGAGGEHRAPQTRCPYTPAVADRGDVVQLTLNIQIKKLDGRRMLLSPEGGDLVVPEHAAPDQRVVNAIGLAYRWHD
ncbi:MAG: recombinase family protein, partial [Planctomycetota bacterium]